MSEKQALDAVAELRQSRQDAAASELARTQAALVAEQNRARELLGYLHEYEQAPAQVSAHWLANRTVFLGRLREAVAAQGRRVEQAEATIEAARTRYTLARQDREVLQRLEDSYRRATACAEERRAHDALDDWIGARRSVSAP